MDDKMLFAPGVVKIAVLGEPKCGKSSFIRTFMTRHSKFIAFKRGPAYVYTGPFQANNEQRIAAIFEFPGDLDIPDLIEALENCRLNAIVLMYAVDNRLSFDMVTEKYFSTMVFWNSGVFSKQVVVLVGSRTERRDDERAIEWLPQDNQVPVTFEEGKELSERLELDDFFEYTSCDVIQMKDAFQEILHMALACMDDEKNIESD